MAPVTASAACVPNGPADRGLRYRINSASLRFVNRDDMKSERYNEYFDHIEEV
jgi:peptide methionine sulfoxide reductase MsrB